MIVKLIEAKRSGGTLVLEEVFVNTEHVTCVRAAAPPMMYEGQLPEGLDKRTEFCKVFLDHEWRFNFEDENEQILKFFRFQY